MRSRVSLSRSGRLDAADQLVELIGSIADVAREAADHFQRLLRLPDLDELADEILVLLQSLQQPGELRAGVVELLGSALGLVLEPAPLIDEELPLLLLEARFLRERLELVVDVIERLRPELRDRTVVGHGAEQRRDRLA